MTLTRAAALGLAALAVYAAVVIAVPGQASAATAYRYWAYYVAHGTGTSTSWQYSQRGPASEYPVDGEVQGWRFAVQLDAANGLLPGAEPTFAKLCASTPAKTGDIRVGVVIDFGLTTDAPAHEKPPARVVPGCVYVHDGATGTDVLAAAARIRIGTGADAGLVCGIDGYPKTECAVAVAAHPAPPAPTHSPTPSPATPQVTASTHSPTATASPADAPVPSVTPIASVASSSPASAAQSSFPPQSPAPAQSSPPTPASASPVSLGALRSNTHHGRGVTAPTIAGIALIVILGAAAVWRTRSRSR